MRLTVFSTTATKGTKNTKGISILLVSLVLLLLFVIFEYPPSARLAAGSWQLAAEINLDRRARRVVVSSCIAKRSLPSLLERRLAFEVWS